MGIEVTLYCDRCGTILAAAHTQAVVRREAKKSKLYRRLRGRDLCNACLVNEGFDPANKPPKA